jgi:hypothetical protein
MPSSISFTEVFIIGVMVTTLVMYVRHYYGEVDLVKAKTDGRRYIVRKLPDSQEAAEILARISAGLQRTIKHMRSKYPDDAAVRRLSRNYNPDALSEGGTEVGYTSYSVNKGEKIVLCLRQTGGKFVDENVMMYVALHELGHLMTKEIGHPKAFWDNFKRLTVEAIEIGVYKRVNFESNPKSYCGITISSSVV